MSIGAVDGSGVSEEFLYGSLGQTSLTRLLRPETAGGVTVLGFERACGAKDASLVYIGELGFAEALLVDDTLVARTGLGGAPGGATWFSFDEPFVDSADRPWFRGRYTGASNGRGLFLGTTPAPVFRSGDVIPGLPGFVDPAGAPFPGYDVARDGNHWIAVVKSTTQPSGVVKDGALLSAGGLPLITGGSLPPAFQSVPNENYNSFGQVQITSTDRWAVIGGTPSGFILRDGNMYRRQGHSVNGWTLDGSFRAVALDELGGIAWIARVTVAGGGLASALFREDDLLFKDGDLVDMDGDGVGDPGNTIVDLPGSPGRLVYGDDGSIWCFASIATPLRAAPSRARGGQHARGALLLERAQLEPRSRSHRQRGELHRRRQRAQAALRGHAREFVRLFPVRA